MRNLKGIHHVTAITSSAEKLRVFYLRIGNASSEENRQSRRYSNVSLVFCR